MEWMKIIDVVWEGGMRRGVLCFYCLGETYELKHESGIRTHECIDNDCVVCEERTDGLDDTDYMDIPEGVLWVSDEWAIGNE